MMLSHAYSPKTQGPTNTIHTKNQQGGTGQDRSPPRPLLAVPNVLAYPSTTSVPINVLLHNGPLLCSFNVPINHLSAIMMS